MDDELLARHGLRASSDREPGITRRGRRRFTYLGPDGERVRDAATLRRIEQLAVPPAWTDVWICCDAVGHLQAAGIDARDRKQYRYHDEWTAARAASKFDDLVDFAAALPALRAEVAADLRRRRWTRSRLVSLGVRLLDRTAMRVGNGRYTEENGSFGLTTLLPDHDQSSRRLVRFRYPAKGGTERLVEAPDRTAARLVRHCRRSGSGTLLSVTDRTDEVHDLSARAINERLRDFDTTAKTFRTWSGSVTALGHLYRCRDEHAMDRCRIEAADAAADHLGNTRAVARASYIHPAVLEASADDIAAVFARTRRGRQATRTERALARLIR